MSENYLIHIGNKNSGRYPRGSGERPNQHQGFFRKKIDRQKNRVERRETARDSYKLSDEELNSNINRLQRENQLKDLTKRVNSGRGITNKIAKDSSNRFISGVVGAAAGAAGALVVKKLIEKDKYKQLVLPV